MTPQEPLLKIQFEGHEYVLRSAVDIFYKFNGNCPECKRLWNEAERVKSERDQLLRSNQIMREALERIKSGGRNIEPAFGDGIYRCPTCVRAEVAAEALAEAEK